MIVNNVIELKNAINNKEKEIIIKNPRIIHKLKPLSTNVVALSEVAMITIAASLVVSLVTIVAIHKEYTVELRYGGAEMILKRK